jgi:hypothetical protein
VSNAFSFCFLFNNFSKLSPASAIFLFFFNSSRKSLLGFLLITSSI